MKQFRLRDKYQFIDLDILKRIGKNTYKNLTDSEIDEEPIPITIESDSQYLLSLNSYGNNDFRRYVAPCTFSEILMLTNYKEDSKFVKQFRNGLDSDFTENMFAIYCAKKINDYKYGRIRKIDDATNTFVFVRNSINDKKHTTKELFVKEFSLSA